MFSNYNFNPNICCFCKVQTERLLYSIRPSLFVFCTNSIRDGILYMIFILYSICATNAFELFLNYVLHIRLNNVLQTDNILANIHFDLI